MACSSQGTSSLLPAAVDRIGLHRWIIAQVHDGGIFRIHREQFVKLEVLERIALLGMESLVHGKTGFNISRPGKDDGIVEAMIMEIRQESRIQLHFPGRYRQS